jgi:type III pantothenate kinase
MNLVVDIGNSFVKLFVFENNKLIHFQQHNTIGQSLNSELFSVYPVINHAIISSVAEMPFELVDLIKQVSHNLIVLDHNTPVPIKNSYKTPETLGKDRLAGIVGAYNIYKGQNVLAIDCGTALTFDLINQQAEYIGGNISPGLNMRFNALNHFTKRLPLLEKNDSFELMGKSTEEAIIAGVQNGIIFEIDAYINKLKVDFTDLKVILTGGDTFFFAHKLKNTIFAEPYLVAIGLNRILQYNVK